MTLEGRDANGNVTHPHLVPGYTYDGEPEGAFVSPQGEAPEDLSALKVADLRALAEERGIDHEGLKKAELVEALS